MQIDLEHLAPPPEPIRAQVCIIGAGIAGLTLAHRLNQKGIDVALLEAGGLALEPEGQSLLAAAHCSSTPHAGTHEGRFRAFGGASLRWGGQLLPMSEAEQVVDLQHERVPRVRTLGPGQATMPESAWPISTEDLKPYDAEAQALLGVDELPYEAAAFFAATFTPIPPLIQQLPELTARLSKWAPFPRRNMAASPGRELLASTTTRVYLHAQVTELVLAPTRTHLQSVLVRNRAGATFRFEATHYVLAAGTVETSRLLLASRSVAPEGVGNAHDQVGRNFHDHLSIPAATLTGQARKRLLHELRPWIFDTSRFGPTLFGPSPLTATLHSAKLEASPTLCQSLQLNPILAHLTLTEPPGTGLAAIRELLTARQHGSFASAVPAATKKLPRAALDALRLAWSANIHNRRFVPGTTTVRLQLNAAQDTPSTSRITLSSELDPFGLPQPILDWRISANELDTFRRFATHLRARFDGLDGFAWLPELFTPDAPLLGLGDARHAMGGACMGLDPRTSVVDPNLTVHGVANLHITGGATFPNGSPQLITLPLMSLALRLADRLISITKN
jgi:choline dehydrogenase-like flavoprotein